LKKKGAHAQQRAHQEKAYADREGTAPFQIGGAGSGDRIWGRGGRGGRRRAAGTN